MQKIESEDNKHNITGSMKRADFILFVVCLFFAFFSGIFFIVHRREGDILHITCDGIEAYQIELGITDDKSETEYYLILYEQQEEPGTHLHIMHSEDYPMLPEGCEYNLFSVTEDLVRMEAADCRDQICVHHKPISLARENIICLPHKLVIEISGDGNTAAVTKHKGQSENSDAMSQEPLDGTVR